MKNPFILLKSRFILTMRNVNFIVTLKLAFISESFILTMRNVNTKLEIEKNIGSVVLY